MSYDVFQLGQKKITPDAIGNQARQWESNTRRVLLPSKSIIYWVRDAKPVALGARWGIRRRYGIWPADIAVSGFDWAAFALQ